MCLYLVTSCFGTRRQPVGEDGKRQEESTQGSKIPFSKIEGPLNSARLAVAAYTYPPIYLKGRYRPDLFLMDLMLWLGAVTVDDWRWLEVTIGG